MTKEQKIDLVTRYINGENINELAAAFSINPGAVRYTLTHIYQPRRKGRLIDVENSALPNLARWLNDNGYSEVWLAKRLGISKQQVSHYFTGTSRVMPWQKAQICEVTGLTMAEAFGERKEA